MPLSGSSSCAGGADAHPGVAGELAEQELANAKRMTQGEARGADQAGAGYP